MWLGVASAERPGWAGLGCQRAQCECEGVVDGHASPVLFVFGVALGPERGDCPLSAPVRLVGHEGGSGLGEGFPRAVGGTEHGCGAGWLGCDQDDYC
jgi:hypothetical protein